MDNQESNAVSQDSKNLALLLWLGTIFFGFIPSLVLYLVKKDDAYLLDQSKEALNWSITAILGVIAGMILAIILIGILVIWVVALCNLIFGIMGVIAASSGKPFRVPFALRLIK
jgi:uncharacterized Tic20 family protein